MKKKGMNGHGKHHKGQYEYDSSRDRAHLSHHSTDEGLNHGRHAKSKRQKEKERNRPKMKFSRERLKIANMLLRKRFDLENVLLKITQVAEA